MSSPTSDAAWPVAPKLACSKVPLGEAANKLRVTNGAAKAVRLMVLRNERRLNCVFDFIG